MNKHTPGPWRVDKVLTDLGAPMVVSYKRVIAKVLYSGGSEDPAVHSNALLISAAPDLLEALEYLTKQINLSGLKIKKDFSLINAHANACKAIYKAKGETE
jgi:hypothetical protein